MKYSHINYLNLVQLYAYFNFDDLVLKVGTPETDDDGRKSI